MKNFVITISREFGCAGREIGRGIASELGVKFYDRELIDFTINSESSLGCLIPFTIGINSKHSSIK